MRIFSGKTKYRCVVSAVVTRADGRVEDLGVISTSDKETLWQRLKKKAGE